MLSYKKNKWNGFGFVVAHNLTWNQLSPKEQEAGAYLFGGKEMWSFPLNKIAAEKAEESSESAEESRKS